MMSPWVHCPGAAGSPSPPRSDWSGQGHSIYWRPLRHDRVSKAGKGMALIGRMNTLEVLKHTDFGLYLDGGMEGEILLPRRYIPRDTPTEVGDWLIVFVSCHSIDRPFDTPLARKGMENGFHSLEVVAINGAGDILDWGVTKDMVLPHSEEKCPLQVGD